MTSLDRIVKSCPKFKSTVDGNSFFNNNSDPALLSENLPTNLCTIKTRYLCTICMSNYTNVNNSTFIEVPDTLNQLGTRSINTEFCLRCKKKTPFEITTTYVYSWYALVHFNKPQTELTLRFMGYSLAAGLIYIDGTWYSFTKENGEWYLDDKRVTIEEINPEVVVYAFYE